MLVPDENTSGSSDGLLASGESLPSSAPVPHQYLSRRELHAADAKTRSRANVRGIRGARPVVSARAATRRLNAPPSRPARVVPPTGPAPTKAPGSSLKRKSKNPAVVVLTLLLVPGFIAAASLPAYAFAPAGSAHQAQVQERLNTVEGAALPSQELAVRSEAAAATVTRDVIGATTEAELEAQKVAAAAVVAQQAALAAAAAASAASAVQLASDRSGRSSGGSSGSATSGAGSVRAAGDDYPWPSAANTMSPLNYYYRQCVDFVAWRLNRDAGSTSGPFRYVWSNLTPNGGNASEWRSAWQNKGWMTSSEPVVGAVAWFTGNHVAYVKEVVGSNVIIEEYNFVVKRGYGMRTIPSSSVPTFLYPPPR